MSDTTGAAQQEQRPAHRHAVVIGGGLAGMLAAAALAPHAEQVTVIERDTLPAGPEARVFLPQAPHAHVLWSGGSRALEDLLPGFEDRLLAAGARHIPLTAGMVAFSPRGWYRRWKPTHHLISCTRPLLDWVVRDLVTALPNVRVLEGTRVRGLCGGADRITGVRILRPDGTEDEIPAAFTVEASGRATQAPRWLSELGVPDVLEEVVDSGLVYASRMYQAPAGTEEFPVVTVQAVANSGQPGRSVTMLPVEGGRWLVTLIGTRGAQPTSDPDAFEEYARTVRHPVVAELLAYAKPLSDVTTFANTANRRRYYEKARAWPEGFLVAGDAAAAFNPVYGHGMSVAAQAARALRDCLNGHGLHAPRLARRAQRAVARPVSVAWSLATGQDIFYPGVIGKTPTTGDRLLARYVDRLVHTATGDFLVATALTEVMALSAPLSALVRPRVLWHALRGPRLPQLSGPPLTESELRFMTRTDAEA
ncbi:NAD(P)/FAD-dependent oxidoreductase [Streptomyces sp. 12297]|uniref:NAD(P)/FAD-dependent oxidoreductase n=1 Tax=Streptomyces sp. NBC_00239 TaxID=2903640 RepID=UPI002E27B6A5|nr:FAD-dependent monooxygenase [Streptomyces sp. NBC_00239]